MFLVSLLFVAVINPYCFLNSKFLLHQACAGHRLVRTWFLEIDLVRKVCVCVCVCIPVCLPPRLVTTSGMMWRDMDPI